MTATIYDTSLKSINCFAENSLDFMKFISDPDFRWIQRMWFRWKHNRFNVTPYKVAQWGQKRTRWPSNWFSSTNPLIWKNVIQ